MKTIALAAALAVAAVPALAQDHAHMDHGERKAVLMEGLGTLHHQISTKSAEAQQFFDQGMRLVYAFNHEEAAASFRRAGELDPDCAMAYWGIALALGPNINLDVDPDREKAAYDAVQHARTLEAKAPENE